MALRDLQIRGFDPRVVSFLGLGRVIASGAAAASGRGPRELQFSTRREAVCCTDGPLADWFQGRIGQGAVAVGDALRHGLPPRHAARLSVQLDRDACCFGTSSSIPKMNAARATACWRGTPMPWRFMILSLLVLRREINAVRAAAPQLRTFQRAIRDRAAAGLSQPIAWLLDSQRLGP